MNNKMPAIFIGHGSPMLAIQDNPFTPKWRQAAQAMPKPKAILVISAHWISMGVAETAAANPALNYDFYGFPEALYQVQYPVQGAPALAAQVKDLVNNPNISLDMEQGLDHGTWAVLKQMYPAADIPVVQLSLGGRLTMQQHLELAKQLKPLREQGVLILGSGNLIHNLRLIDWQRSDQLFGYDWAQRAQQTLLDLIRSGDLPALADYRSLGEDVQKAIPTPEHYLPLLYILALQDPDDKLNIFNTDFVGGSLDMTCVQVG
ncbi:4,5-DOPA dioxygenase extradiol [Testudinibacter sp. TR-2022]|uniref:4,5-DOPA-extradiol-dioxygenase n=1 Tax=Testudinibacter sp. TR-2022 TaxID=2585029 RepID=UPI00111A125D|nr:4,5-DOPA dioxygenase extradiol [Testudinibacter sp. TR-2022]TNH05721.1 4,5-DOPA dioxygenase extradiol [Pasteurellaceae bacterium Phil31]TNH10202.1 4,5-DOPA dioxygenase extradiol [Testudinibacter sp. TR-2022]TNH11833.1 4,5-DOPA dioxygenase extradiol [Testudinibacter sp. TR-2022]TNH12449.1 4,5-DOPA dioxygenase extradiol [Testudinibacter sp. TR-2022]TNH19374.1 4,5-DOPA dioxygenase extradiol [Testudinibacter sp. TR-2022]